MILRFSLRTDEPADSSWEEKKLKKKRKREKRKEKHLSEVGEQIWLGDKGLGREKLPRIWFSQMQW